jgi:hypothetical protein
MAGPAETTEALESRNQSRRESSRPRALPVQSVRIGYWTRGGGPVRGGGGAGNFQASEYPVV